MKDSLLYAPEDRQHAQELLLHLPGVQMLEISDEALTILMSTAVRRVLLLMSIDLLHRLVCESQYRVLYRQLKLFEREEMMIVVYLRACHWQDRFGHSTVFPSAGSALTVLTQGNREALYQQLAAQL